MKPWIGNYYWSHDRTDFYYDVIDYVFVAKKRDKNKINDVIMKSRSYQVTSSSSLLPSRSIPSLVSLQHIHRYPSQETEMKDGTDLHDWGSPREMIKLICIIERDVSWELITLSQNVITCWFPKWSCAGIDKCEGIYSRILFPLIPRVWRHQHVTSIHHRKIYVIVNSDC